MMAESSPFNRRRSHQLIFTRGNLFLSVFVTGRQTLLKLVSLDTRRQENPEQQSLSPAQVVTARPQDPLLAVLISSVVGFLPKTPLVGLGVVRVGLGVGLGVGRGVGLGVGIRVGGLVGGRVGLLVGVPLFF